MTSSFLVDNNGNRIVTGKSQPILAITPTSFNFFDDSYWVSNIPTTNGMYWTGAFWKFLAFTFGDTPLLNPISSGPNADWEIGFRPTSVAIDATFHTNGFAATFEIRDNMSNIIGILGPFTPTSAPESTSLSTTLDFSAGFDINVFDPKQGNGDIDITNITFFE